MKKNFFYAAIVLITISSCSKDTSLSPNEQPLQEITTAAATTNGVNAIPINEKANFDYYNYLWNTCTNEWIQLAGSGHFELHRMISEDKITYVLHFNLSNVSGIGVTSGTEYITTQAFNYSNTKRFTGSQQVFQQSASMLFITPGGENSFRIENDWHLTVNANGYVTFFFTTGGDVFSCL